MNDGFEITREIGIDAGHRVTWHGSKCRNLHGHRYTVQALGSGPLGGEGEQLGMVLDFGFLKEEMLAEIDAPCDHGMILWIDDPILREFEASRMLDKPLAELSAQVQAQGAVLCRWCGGKLYLV